MHHHVRRAIAVLSCAVIVAAISAAGATGYTWRNIKVGGGGYIPGIIFSPVEKNLAYLRSDMGGIYRWDAKAKCWLPLQDDNPEPNYRGIESIAPDPVDGAVVYAAVGTYRNGPSAILRSSNRGRTWETIPVPFRMGGNEEGRGLGERLAVDPNDTSVLYFGSRYDGLQRSTDRGKTWAKVDSFPLPGLGVPDARQRPHAGISFVVFDKTSGGKGARSRTIFVGVADPGAQHLFRTDDGGQTWTAIAGGPEADFLPAQAQLDSHGILYITYANSMGPWGVNNGAVYKFDTHGGAWTDISPEPGPAHGGGGYMGLSLDRQHDGTLIVATLNHADPGDIIWRSTDSGAHWQNIRTFSKRDVRSVPFLYWGRKEAEFGWWITGLAIDPFDSGHVGYTTGATVYGTTEIANADRKKTVLWKPWVEGVEQTAVITLSSPAIGPHLISGFGDIGGFVHTDFKKSLPITQGPMFTNTNTVDYAERAPNVIVRSGTHAAHAKTRTATLGYSIDSGKTWHSLFAPLPNGYTEIPPDKIGYNYGDPYIDAAILTSADGKTFVVTTPEPVLTADHGKSWSKIAGLPAGIRPVADRVDSKRFYAIDYTTGTFFISTNGARSFAAQPSSGLPADIKADRPDNREAPSPLIATPNVKGELWYLSKAAGGRLYRSSDGGKTFVALKTDFSIYALDLGKAAPGKKFMTLFVLSGEINNGQILRSTDNGATWLQINDDQHQYHRAFRCISADKRVFGRVYIGTDGRGIIYGEPSRMESHRANSALVNAND